MNDVLLCDDWDESKVFSKFSDFVPTDKELDCNIPLGKAENMVVNIELNDKRYFNTRIDDFIGVSIDTGRNKAQLKAVSSTVIGAASHQMKGNLSMQREPLIARGKCEAE